MKKLKKKKKTTCHFFRCDVTFRRFWGDTTWSIQQAISTQQLIPGVSSVEGCHLNKLSNGFSLRKLKKWKPKMPNPLKNANLQTTHFFGIHVDFQGCNQNKQKHNAMLKRERERWWNSGTESHFCLRDFIPQWMLNNKLKLKLCTPKCIILNLNFDGLGSFAKISYVCWEQNVHPFLCGPCGRHIIPKWNRGNKTFPKSPEILLGSNEILISLSCL